MQPQTRLMNAEQPRKEQALTEITRAAQSIEDAKDAVTAAEALRDSLILYWWDAEDVLSAIEAGQAAGIDRKRVYQIRKENA